MPHPYISSIEVGSPLDDLDLVDRSEDLFGFSIGDYLGIALDKEAIDPLNASRILASNISGLPGRVHEGIVALSAKDTGEPVEDRIVAPLLRVGADFAAGDAVWAQTSPGAPWRQYDILAVDEVDDTISVRNLAFSPQPHANHVVDPKSVPLFSERDYAILQRPVERRPHLLALSARYMIGLSYFDRAYAEASTEGMPNSDPLSSVFRHFHLGGLRISLATT